MTLTEDTKRTRMNRLVSILVLLFFIAVLLIGFAIYGDYSANVDEAIQRKHVLINYTYINEEVLGRNMDKLRATGEWLNEDGDGEGLANYRSRSYGVALQLPTVMIEDANDFQMTTQEIFQMRHIYNFLIYFSGLVALFFLLKEVIDSQLIALAGTASFYLFPHFFASSYYNVKDMLFIPMFIWACLFMVRMLKHGRKLSDTILFVLFTALASNIRIYGIMPLACAFVCMIIEDIVRKKSGQKGIQQELELPQYSGFRHVSNYLILVFGFLAIWLLLAPAAWINPLDYIGQVVSKAASFDMWESTMLFEGQNIGLDAVPWYYLPLWMSITIPVFQLALFLVGSIYLVRTLFGAGAGVNFIKNRILWIFFLMFFILLFAQILLGISIYLGWRHMYVLYVPLIVMVAYGIKRLHQSLVKRGTNLAKAFVPIITIIAIAVAGVRVAVNHPYQHSMFNAFGIPVADQFDRDYYRMSAKQCIEWLFEEFPGRTLEISSDVQLTTPSRSFSPKQQEMIVLRSQEPDMSKFHPAEFYIDVFRFTPGNDSDMLQKDYTEIHSIWVDGTKIASVLRNDHIEEFDRTGIYDIPMSYFKTISGVKSADGTEITSTGAPGYLTYGNYTYLEKGNYIAHIHMELDNDGGKDKVANMDVAIDGGATSLTEQSVYASDFAETGEVTLLLPFKLGAAVPTVEFRVANGEGVVLTVDKITLYRK